MPSTSSTASCSPGTRSEPCPSAKAQTLRPQPCAGAPAGPLTAHGASAAPNAVFTVGRDVFPSLPPAEDLHCLRCCPPREPPASSLLAVWLCRYPALCQRPPHPTAVPPLPRVTLLSLSLLQPMRVGVETDSSPGGPWHSWLCPCAVCVLVCTGCTGESATLSPDGCWARASPCHAAAPASPDAPALCTASWARAVPGREASPSCPLPTLPRSLQLLSPKLHSALFSPVPWTPAAC